MKFHFCKICLKFIGLGYEPYIKKNSYDIFGCITYKLFRCTKCNKLIYKNKNYYRNSYKESFEEQIESIKKMGYKPLNELLEGENKIDE